MRQRLLNRACAGLAALMVVGGCAREAAVPVAALAPADPGAPPARLAIGQDWTTSKSGFVFTAAYFTAAQVRDARWEKARLNYMRTVGACTGGQRVVRRDVRWLPATPVSGQACAAVVYSVKCGVPTGADDDSVEYNRNAMLYGEIPFRLEHACGEKDVNRQPGYDSAIANYRKDQAMLVDGDVCDRTAPTRDDPVVLTAATRIATETRIDRALAARLRDERITESRFAEIPHNLSWSLRRAGRIANIFPADNIVSDDPAHIRITLVLGLNKRGRPYCVQLTARQAGRVWRRTIEREGPIDFKRFGLRQEFNSPPLRPGDGNPASDAGAMVGMLAVSLGLPSDRPGK